MKIIQKSIVNNFLQLLTNWIFYQKTDNHYKVFLKPNIYYIWYWKFGFFE